MNIHELWPSHRDECPSELMLDRIQLGEVQDAELSQHVEDCPHCQARLGQRSQAYEALSAPQLQSLIGGIHRGVAGAAPQPRGWIQSLFERVRPLTAVAAIGAAVILIAVIKTGPMPTKGRLTTKGSPGLTVYRERTGKVSLSLSGERFLPNDRLRFEVNVEEGRHLMIIGMESSGALYAAYPTDGSRGSVVAPEGKRVLPGSVELDESTGQEWLHLISCPKPFSMEALKAQGRTLEAPAECRLTRFELNKEPQ